jgi:hypothetical protein
MEQVSGYVAFDGKFFASDEACKAHEDEIQRIAEVFNRAKAVIECFSQGIYLSKKPLVDSLLPEPLLEFIAAIPEQDLEDLWNNQIMHLFLVEECAIHDRESRAVLYEIPASGGSRNGNDRDYFMLRAEATHRLLSFVLGKA